MPAQSRSLVGAIFLLILLGLTYGIVAAPLPEFQPACGENSAIPVLPLGVEFPGFELSSYGRSAAALSPGEVLCLALAWRIYIPGAAENRLLQVQAIDEGGMPVATTLQPIIIHPSDQTSRVLQIVSLLIPARAAAGRHNLVITVLDEQGLAVSSPVTISVIQVSR